MTDAENSAQPLRRVRLQDKGDVRRYAAWLIRSVEAGNIPEGRAKAINSILRTLRKAVELGDLRELEGRLEALELEAAANETTSRQALNNRLKRLELMQGISKLGQWIIVGVRGQVPGESNEGYKAYRTAAVAEARESAAWDGLVIEVPEGFERDPRDPPGVQSAATLNNRTRAMA